MQRGAFVVAVVIALAGLNARAQEKEEKPSADRGARLPFNPYAKAAEGDWLVFQKHIRIGDSSETNTIFTEVTKVTGDDVTVTSVGLDPPPEMAGVKGEQRPSDRTFSKQQPPTVSDYLDGMPVSKVSIKDDKRVVGGKPFACRAISFAMDDPEKRGSKVELTIWLSPEVKAGGLVAMTIKGAGSVEGAVVGYGTKGKTLFGKSVEEVKAEIAKAAKKDDAGKGK